MGATMRQIDHAMDNTKRYLTELEDITGTILSDQKNQWSKMQRTTSWGKGRRN